MATFAPTISMVPQGPLTGPGSDLRLPPGQGTIGTGAQQIYPRYSLTGGALAGTAAAPGGGPRVVDVGTATPDPTTTGSIGGGQNLPTLDALLARQQELAGQQPQMGEMISPWQGVSYMANQLMHGLEEGRVNRQEASQRETLAKILSSPNPDVGQLALISPEIALHVFDQQNKETKGTWDPIPTPQGENGQWAKNSVTGELKKVGGGSPGEGGWKPSDLGTLRDDYTKAASSYTATVPAWDSMQRSFDRVKDIPAGGHDPNAGAADYDLVVGLAKLLDPNSVVREGEVETVKQTGGAADYLIAYLNTLTGGGSLSPEQRRGLMQTAYSRVKGYYDQAKQYREWISGIAGRHGITVDDVVPPLPELREWNPGQGDQPGTIEDD